MKSFSIKRASGIGGLKTHWPNWIILILGSYLSVRASTTGFSSFLGFESAIPANAVILVIIVQCMMIISAREMFVTRKLVYVCAYLCGSCFSILFGIPYFMASTGLENQIATERVEENSQVLMADIERSRQKLFEFQSAFDSLADYSRVQAQRETEGIGTCLDGVNLSGPGPRQRLRLNDEKITALHSSRLGELTNSLDQLANIALSGNSNKDVQLLRSTAIRTAALTSSSQIFSARRWVNERLESGTSQFMDASSGKYFSCPDSVFDELGKGILSIQFEQANLPELHITREGSSTKLSFSMLAALASGDIESLSTYHYLAILLALCVDGVVLFSLYSMNEQSSSLKRIVEGCIRIEEEFRHGFIKRFIDEFSNELTALQRMGLWSLGHLIIDVVIGSRMEAMLLGLERFGLAVRVERPVWHFTRWSNSKASYKLNRRHVKELLVHQGMQGI